LFVGWKAEKDDILFAELKFKVKSGTAQAHASTIQAQLDKIVSKI